APKKTEEPQKPQKEGFFGLEEEYEIVNKPVHQTTPTAFDESEDDMESKREKLMEQARERIKKIQSMKGNDYSSDSFREKLEVPAYLRRKVDMQDVPHSSEKNISRFNLNDDNQILGNNKFLHDNVD